MADALLYKHALEKIPYEFDFAEQMDGTDTLNNIGDGSSVTATDSSGTDVSAFLLDDIVRVGTVLRARLIQGINGQEYRVVYIAQITDIDNTKHSISQKTLELRLRNELEGSF